MSWTLISIECRLIEQFLIERRKSKRSSTLSTDDQLKGNDNIWNELRYQRSIFFVSSNQFNVILYNFNVQWGFE